MPNTDPAERLFESLELFKTLPDSRFTLRINARELGDAEVEHPGSSARRLQLVTDDTHRLLMMPLVRLVFAQQLVALRVDGSPKETTQYASYAFAHSVYRPLTIDGIEKMASRHEGNFFVPVTFERLAFLVTRHARNVAPAAP